MANTRYENFVLENELKDQLNTRLNMLDYLTPDDSLMGTPGMTKKVHVYTATGEAEDVAEGEGNTQSIEMTYAAKDYVVGTTQGRFIYTDEDEMTDDFMVEAGMSKLSESLTNHLRAKVAANTGTPPATSATPRARTRWALRTSSMPSPCSTRRTTPRRRRSSSPSATRA